jgi:hypothetical protein
MDPTRIDQGWYIEHAKNKRGLLWRSLPTVCKLVFPNRFWKRVSVEGEIRLGRIFLWMGLWFGLFHLLSSASVLLSYHQNVLKVNADMRKLLLRYPNTPKSNQSLLTDVTTLSYWYDLVQSSILYPFDSSMRNGSGSIDIALECFWAALGMVLLWCVILGVVPTTRRIAKIRYLHVIRGMLISLVGLVIVFPLGALTESLYLIKWNLNTTSSWYNRLDMLADSLRISLIGFSLMYLVWIQWLWIAAVRVGWQIRPSWVLVVLGFIASVLGGFTAMLVISVY